MIALRFPFVRRCIIVDFAASRRNRKYSIEEEFWVLFLPLSLYVYLFLGSIYRGSSLDRGQTSLSCVT